MREGFGPTIITPGHIGVDFETRVDFDRLRNYRIERARKALDSSEFRRAPALRLYNIRLRIGHLDRRCSR